MELQCPTFDSFQIADKTTVKNTKQYSEESFDSFQIAERSTVKNPKQYTEDILKAGLNIFYFSGNFISKSFAYVSNLLLNFILPI